MTKKWQYLCRCLLVLVFIGGVIPAKAQLVERVCRTDYKISPERKGELLLELDNISFFKDNEFAGTVIKGYSLPGLWIQPKFVYYPLKNIKLEGGVHMLWFSGAYRYPSVSYQDIALWKGEQYQKGAHLLPFFRAQISMKSVDLILGNIYGGSNHGLIAPLYNPELNLTADPETGFRVLAGAPGSIWMLGLIGRVLSFGMILIEEAFTVGLSTRFKLNAPSSTFHCYIPLQILAQHRGGEIDTIRESSVQTLMNGAVGAGVTWNIDRRILKRVNVELDAAGYYQQKGELWPYHKGIGVYSSAFVDLGNFRVKMGHWICNDFITMFGIPYFGTVSTKKEGITYDKPQTLLCSIEYSRMFGKHYALGLKADAYQFFPGTMRSANGELTSPGSTTSFSVGVYFRINPSFLLKNF